MPSLYHNVTGELTKELLAPGDGFNPASIELTNIHGSIPCTIDLYIEKKLLGKFYMLKDVNLPIGATLIRDINIANRDDENGFGLYIKLTKSASETPAVDVIIKQ
tara:strand:+ start:141 stop:455 length:315 start_codon:yes stop_codon:yes gene_type:complete